MTLTIQQLQEKAQTLLPDAQIFVKGASGEEYPVKEIIADGELLTILVEDEVSDLDEEDTDGEE